MASESKMNPFQSARAESLQIAGSVLSNTKAIFGGGKSSPAPVESITDLLTVAEWVYGDPIADMNSLDNIANSEPMLDRLRARLAKEGYEIDGAIEIPPEMMPSLFQMLSRGTPDCGHPECVIHAPMREASGLDPEKFGTPEQKNPFVDPHEVWKKTHGTHEDPIDFGNMEQTGMAEASDFEGGESDVEADEDAKYPPRVSANEYFTGTVMNDRKGGSWVVRNRSDGGKRWEQVIPDAVAVEERREQDVNEDEQED